MRFKHLGEIFCSLSEMLQPPERLTVSQAASKYRYVNSPGSYVGKWFTLMVQYMREPMDTFTSREYSGMIFAGPAQSAKTDCLVLNTLTYSIKVEPMDMMIVCPTNVAARDFSIRRIDRLHRHSTEVGDMLVQGASSDNVFDKHYTNGMLMTLSWPTPTELAGKPIPRIVLTDRDRMVDDVAGDGEPFDLAGKRTTTFGSYAMTVAESSPSRPVENLKWIARTPHEAPPAGGIMALYNRGDRRRWYWPCPSCGEYFEGNFKHLTWERAPGQTNHETGETVRMICPHCAFRIHPDQREEMQLWGVWVKDGQGVDREGRVFGPSARTTIASFWLNGVAASFTNWKKLVAMYLDADDTFQNTGKEGSLTKFYNNDLGEPYYPRSANDLRLPETLKSRAEKLRERHVPAGVRFLIATVDVQKNMWRVNVYGILPGAPFDVVVIDRFDIRKSKRLDDEGEHLWVKPHAYLEDWDEITEHVIEREYPLDDDTGRMMGVKFVGCDSGGKEGVTTMAYSYYRKLREQNKHRRFILIKGDKLTSQPRARLTYPDSSKKDSKSGARGDIPVLNLNVNLLKDDLDGRLDSLIPGKGMIRFADWMPDTFYSELCSEIRTLKGWENPSGHRNEDWDLTVYCLGLCVSELLRVEHLDWQNAPNWAGLWDVNDLVRKPEEAPRFQTALHSARSFADFARALA